MIGMILLIGAAALLVKFWKAILDFLNGPIRSLLVKLFGEAKCQWYVDFLLWCDNKLTCAKRIVKMQWAKFQNTVLKIKSVFHKNPDGTYTKNTETLVRKDETKAHRVVTEETVDWAYLPNEVRAEMVRRRTNDAELDERELVAEQVRKRAAEEGIELTA